VRLEDGVATRSDLFFGCLDQRHHEPPEVTSADPVPELTEPELELESVDDVPEELPVPLAVVVPDESSVVVAEL
jgi:hypothetical protein